MAHRKRRSSKDTADLSTKVTMTPVKSTCCGLSKAVKQEMFELVSQLLDGKYIRHIHVCTHVCE